MGHGVNDTERAALDARRAELTEQYLKPREVRPASTARGVHHVALISSSVERTIQFFDGLLGFPLIEMFENRDYAGSTHFFFDLGHGNTLACYPGVCLPYNPRQPGLLTMVDLIPGEGALASAHMLPRRRPLPEQTQKPLAAAA